MRPPSQSSLLKRLGGSFWFTITNCLRCENLKNLQIFKLPTPMTNQKQLNLTVTSSLHISDISWFMVCLILHQVTSSTCLSWHRLPIPRYTWGHLCKYICISFWKSWTITPEIWREPWVSNEIACAWFTHWIDTKVMSKTHEHTRLHFKVDAWWKDVAHQCKQCLWFQKMKKSRGLFQ